MAPARLIHKRQQEILLGFLEENKEMLNGMAGDAHTHENFKQKWTAIARKLNAVDTGLVKSPIDWKKVSSIYARVQMLLLLIPSLCNLRRFF